MAITLNVRPGVTETWASFTGGAYPAFSIALDGFVAGRTERSLAGPFANFDHHAGVDRIATRCTAEQIHLEINLGLFQTFQKEGVPTAHIFVNDCDEDTCLSIWMLRNHARIANHADPLINRLVYCNDRLDTTSGSYPFGNLDIMRTIAWIFEPYQELRAARKLGLLKDPAVMSNVIETVCARITAYSLGRAEERPLKNGLRTIAVRPTFYVIEEEGPLSRMSLDGGRGFLSVLGDGRYVLGRKSVWTRFPLHAIYDALNAKDPAVTVSNRWGGSDIIGGSPRATGSSLSVDEIVAVIEEEVVAP